jgi:hypothetical protein
VDKNPLALSSADICVYLRMKFLGFSLCPVPDDAKGRPGLPDGL